MGVAHFNPHAYLAQKSADGTKEAYPGMTAIDFKGHNDVYGANGAHKPYELGWSTQTGQFYTPLLDDDGLLSIRNCDETQNLLAYAPSSDVNAKTHGVLTSYFTEPVYADHYDNTAGYRLSARHLLQVLMDTSYRATSGLSMTICSWTNRTSMLRLPTPSMLTT